MAGFVREHADDLVRRLRLHDRAVVHEDAAAVGDEGVEDALVDDDHLDVLLFQTGGAQDRPRVFAQQLLGLGVAEHRRTLVLLRQGRATAAHGKPPRPSISAVSFERSSCARRLARQQSSNPWSLALRPDTLKTITSRRIRPVGARPVRDLNRRAPVQIADIDARSDTRRSRESAADPLGTERRSALHGDGRDGGRGPHRGGRRPCHSYGSRAAGGAGAQGRDRGRACRARCGADRLHFRARHSLAARADRATLPRYLRLRRRSRAHRDHDRLVGRVHSGAFCRCSSRATASR